MAQRSTNPSQKVGCLAVIFASLLMYIFPPFMGLFTVWYPVHLLLVGAATFGSAFFLAYAVVILTGVLQIYQKVRAQLRYPVSPLLSLLRLEDLPPDFAPTIKNAVSALSPLGFQLLGYVNFAVPGATTYQGILHNQRAGTIARCMLLIQNDNSETVLTFQTRLSDGTDCITGHMSPAYFVRVVRAQPKGRSGLAFFDIVEPARLARLHAAAVEKHDAGLMDTGMLEPMSFLAETIGREMAIQIEAGYLRKEGDEYRPTRIGAWKMAMKLVWPVSAIRIRAAERREERFLEETAL